MLWGRDAEQRAIEQLVAGARIGRGGVLVVTGEPGAGKTALLDAALRHAIGSRVLRATGTQSEREIPFAGLHAVLRPALHLLETIPRPQADALAAALALTEGRPGDRFAIGAATLTLLCRYAEEAPVTLLLDDLQWLDRPSAEALTFAARRVADDPVAILFAARPGEADDVVVGLPALELTGLDPAAARGLLQSTVGVECTDDLLARLHAVTAGNPLALLELGRDPETLMDRAPGVPPLLSARLAAAFSRQLRLLEDEARAVLLVAVVANGDVRLTTSASARLSLDPADLAPAEKHGLISISGGRLSFRHPLLRAVAYSDPDERFRRRAHEVVAGLLPKEDVDRRAWHLSESANGPDETTAEMLGSAAEHAVGRRAYAVASTAYERAARLSSDAGRSSARLLEAAATAWQGGLRERALALLDETESSAASSGPTNPTVRLRASIAMRSGSVIEAREMLERAAAQAESPDDAVVLLAEAVQASVCLADSTGIRRLGEALRSAVGKATTSRATAVGLTASGIVRVFTGEGGREEFREAIQMLTGQADPLTHPDDLSWLMVATLYRRDSEGAEVRRIIDGARSRVDVGVLPHLLFLVARDQATSTAWARAEANYEESIRMARETGQSTDLAMSLAGLAWLESRQGKSEACRSHAAEAASLCADRAISVGELWCLFALGDLELAQGAAAAAAERLLGLDHRLQELGFADPDVFPGPELVDALVRLGRDDHARDVATRFATAAEDKGRPWSVARAQRASGLIALDDNLDVPFHAALETHRHTLDVFETARTQLAYGSRLRRAARRVDARVQLRAALVTFEELGAARWSDAAAAELEATGEKVPRREPTGLGALTPQELQVSLLLAEGRTTRDAAAALFISPKTVEYHLRKVYTKLGIHSRDELAEALPR